MAVLENLEPKNVFHFFEKICNIPHPSYKEKQISDFLVNFAKERSLEYYQDSLYNVIIIKEATPGYEEVAPIILQGHMDMVCEKEANCNKDMDKEGLDLEVNGDFISAKGTTLGGDDGIAVAYALAVLDSNELQHPRLEFVCTVSEEVGMEGATGIDVSMLKGKKLLNMDSENEGRMLVSCAGGCSAQVNLPVQREKATGAKLTIRVDGLVGGHSGVEIDKGRANANMLMARTLREIQALVPFSLITLEGGSKDNAIPRDATATIMITDAQAMSAAASVDQAMQIIAAQITTTAANVRAEYASADPDINITITNDGKTKAEVVTVASTKGIISMMLSIPNGIQRMSRDIEGLVETSLNLGICSLDAEALHLRYAVRSSVGTAKDDLVGQMTFVAQMQGGSIVLNGNYPAWEYTRESTMREDMIRIFTEMFGHEPIMEAIHAGVECGILSGKIEGLDCVSMGPDIIDIHTPSEKLSISSTKRMYDYVVNILSCK